MIATERIMRERGEKPVRLRQSGRSVVHTLAEGRQTGRDLPVIDGLLLATAAAHDLTLVTSLPAGA